jgi:hypothetical protein
MNEYFVVVVVVVVLLLSVQKYILTLLKDYIINERERERERVREKKNRLTQYVC